MRSRALAGAAGRRLRAGPEAQPMQPTLFDLVEVVSEVTSDEREIVAVVQHLLESSRVRRAPALPRAGRD